MGVELIAEIQVQDTLPGEICLFVFREEDEELDTDVGSRWSHELRVSGVEASHFVKVQEQFGSCNWADSSDRERRRSLLKAHFGETGRIWNLVMQVATRNGGKDAQLLQFLRGSSWRAYVLVRGSVGDTVLSRESAAGELDDDVFGLRAVAGVPQQLIARLEEVFSLNHIEDWRFDEGGEPMAMPPSPLPSESDGAFSTMPPVQSTPNEEIDAKVDDGDYLAQ